MEVDQAALVPSRNLKQAIRELSSEYPNKMFQLSKITAGLSRTKIS